MQIYIIDNFIPCSLSLFPSRNSSCISFVPLNNTSCFVFFSRIIRPLVITEHTFVTFHTSYPLRAIHYCIVLLYSPKLPSLHTRAPLFTELMHNTSLFLVCCGDGPAWCTPPRWLSCPRNTHWTTRYSIIELKLCATSVIIVCVWGAETYAIW